MKSSCGLLQLEPHEEGAGKGVHWQRSIWSKDMCAGLHVAGAVCTGDLGVRNGLAGGHACGHARGHARKGTEQALWEEVARMA